MALIKEMNKTILGVFIGFILSGVIWFTSSIVGSKEKLSKHTTIITIKNESDFKIIHAVLKHGYGELSVSNIESNEVAYLGFINKGENSYKLTVQLENGDVLESIAYYFERGVKVTESVKNKEIIQKGNW